jgi:hypothetical protein
MIIPTTAKPDCRSRFLINAFSAFLALCVLLFRTFFALCVLVSFFLRFVITIDLRGLFRFAAFRGITSPVFFKVN